MAQLRGGSTIGGSLATNLEQLTNSSLNLDINTLTVTGDFTMTGDSLIIDATTVEIDLMPTSTGYAKIEIGKGRTGDGSSYIDLIGDATYIDYGLRIIRGAGVNSASQMLHRGTGNFDFINDEIANFVWYVNSTAELYLSANALYPAVTNGLSFGGGSNYWNNGYITNIYGTIRTAAQSYITSLGTLTTLNVDNLNLNGNILTSTGAFTIDSSGSINLDANGSQVNLKDNGTTYGGIQESAGYLRLQSGSTPTTCLTFGASQIATFAGTVVTGSYSGHCVRNITIATSAPGSPVSGDIWIDTT